MKSVSFISLMLLLVVSLCFGKIERNTNAIPFDFRGHWLPVGTNNFKHMAEFGCYTDVVIASNVVKFYRSEDYDPRLLAPAISGINRSRERLKLFGASRPVLKIKFSGEWSDWFHSYSSDWFPIYLIDDHLLSVFCHGCEQHQQYHRSN